MDWTTALVQSSRIPAPPTPVHLLLELTACAGRIVEDLRYDVKLPGGMWRGWDFGETGPVDAGPGDPVLRDSARLLSYMGLGLMNGGRDPETVSQLVDQSLASGAQIALGDLPALALAAGARGAYFESLVGVLRFLLTCGYGVEEIESAWSGRVESAPGKEDVQA